MIYQEQVQQAARDLAGYTLGGADVLRRAMGKKIKEAMDAERPKFEKGAAENGVEAKKASEIIDLLEKLPGVGHKTASVVVAQAFGIPSFPVDTHIHRCAQRWGLTSGKNVATTERDLKKFFPIEEWNKLHIQIIMYARKYCSARSCFGLECPICTSCYPNRKSKFIHKKP